MKAIVTIVVLLMLSPTDFPKRGYDRVLLYRIEMDEQSGIWSLFDAYGNITSRNEGVEIDRQSLSKLIEIVNDTLTYGARHAYSHSPAVGLVFYKGNRIVDWLQIALQTNSISSKSEIRNKSKYYDYIFDDLEYPLTGLSPMGRKRIRQWLQTQDVFDEEYLRWDSISVDYAKLRRKF
jgi:hypothetical protein